MSVYMHMYRCDRTTATNCAAGELQLSTNCSVVSVPLQRGDVAVYRSRHRHRVTTVTAPRTVLAVEWWRGDQTNLPERPGAPGKRLLEPTVPEDDVGAHGHVEPGGDSISGSAVEL